MSSLFDRSISIYEKEGASSLIRKALRKIYKDTYYTVLSIRGHYSLALENQSIEFSAPSLNTIKRNRKRFMSEKAELRDFISEISPDDVVYDIGANTGLYTLFAADKHSNGEVIAFEPYPPNINILKQDINRNKLQNIVVIEMALSDSVGTVEFSQPETDDVGYGSSSIEAEKAEGSIEVPTTTGDQLIADGEIPPPNVVKIDVEGAEPLVLEGLEHTLSTEDCRTIYCEVHLSGSDRRPSVEDFGSSLDDIRSRLSDLGYRVQKIGSRSDTEVFLKAQR